MYKIKTTGSFEKDFKRCVKRGLPMEKLREVMHLLEVDGHLPEIYQPHPLVSNHRGEWECHIQPNWLLVWKQNNEELVMLMLNTGTHSDIFDKKRRRK